VWTPSATGVGIGRHRPQVAGELGAGDGYWGRAPRRRAHLTSTNRSRSGPRRRRTPSCRPAAPTAAAFALGLGELVGLGHRARQLLGTPRRRYGRRGRHPRRVNRT
jgi:hypothetical protein